MNNLSVDVNKENFKIKERRQQVASLLSKSFNEAEIAHQLGISQPTVCRDIKVLKSESQRFVFDLAKSDLAYYFKSSINGIEEAKKESWKIFLDDKTSVHDRLLALKITLTADETRFRLLTEGPAVLNMKSLEDRLNRIEGMEGHRSIDSLVGRLYRLEAAKEIASSNQSVDNGVPYATVEELEQMTPMERYVAHFNWFVKEIMPYYKAEVMRLHGITSDEEYNRRTLEGDQSIYLPQPNNKFEPTWYDERVAHVLNLSYQELQDKFNRGELKHKIAMGPCNVETGGSCDENPVVF